MLIVDPETREENPVGKVGEIWVHGDNVAEGYWRNPQASKDRSDRPPMDDGAGLLANH